MTYVGNNKLKNNILKIGSKKLNRENWKVYHPNGKHMFTCGEKKVKWYLDRDLAKIINKKSIKLTFTPKGNGFDDNELFGKSNRENKCVVSGTDNDLQRHHIVPYCYRTHFPEKYKTKNHHDVVLINHELHSYYERHANKFKEDIGKIYSVKSISELNAEYSILLREYSKNGSILLNTLQSIFLTHDISTHEERLGRLLIVSDLTNIPYSKLLNINYIQLYKLYQLINNEFNDKIIEFKKNNKKKYDHGYQVVQKLDSEKKIKEFVKLWRTHFIETMKPEHMPIGWSIDFRIKTKI